MKISGVSIASTPLCGLYLRLQGRHLEHFFQLEQVQRCHRGLANQSLPPESSLVFLSHLLPLVPVNEALRSLHTESLNLKTKRFKSSDTLLVRLHSFLHSLPSGKTKSKRGNRKSKFENRNSKIENGLSKELLNKSKKSTEKIENRKSKIE